MDNILYLNSRVNQISVVAKASSHRLRFAQLQRVLQQVYTMLASVATRNFFLFFGLICNCLNCNFHLHWNLHFRSSHHLQVSYHCSSPNTFDELARKLFLLSLTLCQIALASAQKPYRRVFLSTQENGDFGAIYVTGQNCGVESTFFLQGTNEICCFFSFLKRIC